MKKKLPTLSILLPLSFLFLLSCGGAGSSSRSNNNEGLVSIPDYSSYGKFSIATDIGSYTYNERSNVYTFAVKESKAEYVLSGYFDGSIIIRNVDNLTDYKGVKITLSNAALVSSAATPTIDYELDKKNVEIKLTKNTSNVLSSYGDAVTVYSKNNVEFSGSGTLELSSYGENRHTVKAEGNMRMYGSSIFNIPYSAHDIFHGKKCYFSSDDGSIFSGKVNVSKGASQVFDFETNSGTGEIVVDGGSFNINDVDSVFKTDLNLTISKNVVVTATNIRETAIAQGDNSTGLTVTNLGRFTVDGEAYTYQS